MATPAQIAIYGGAAGGGKSYGLLLTPLRYKNVPGFGGTIFRKNFNQIFAQGGLWDEATNMYSGIKGAQPQLSMGRWKFCNEEGRIVFPGSSGAAKQRIGDNLRSVGADGF